MSSLNKVTIIGRVGKDPDVKSFANGGRVANLTVATSESWKDKTTGEKKERTEWHRIAIFNEGLVGVVEKYVRKGQLLYIEGQLQTRKWTDQSGADKYTTEVVLKGFDAKLLMVGGKPNSQPATATQPQTAAETAQPQSGIDDEIPF